MKTFSREEAKKTGDKIGIDWDEVSLDQFRAGLDVELEHGTMDSQTNITNDDPILTGKIVLVHLKELPDYYTKLEAMEGDISKALPPGVRPIRPGEEPTYIGPRGGKYIREKAPKDTEVEIGGGHRMLVSDWDREEPTLEDVDIWYDRKIRSWVIQRKDAKGYQIGNSDYAYTREEAEALKSEYLGDKKKEAGSASKEDKTMSTIEKSTVVGNINSLLLKAEKKKDDKIKERILGEIERFIDHYSKAEKSLEGIEKFVKEYEKMTLLGYHDDDVRIDKLFSVAKSVNANSGFNLELDSSDTVGKINSINSVAHNLYLQKDTSGQCKHPILEELVQISKSYQSEYRNPGVIILQDPAKAVSETFDVDMLQKGALERSSKFWKLFEKALKDGVENLSNFEIVALREWLYAKA